MDTLWQDLRFGLRSLLKHPGFTVVAVTALALGIGANTAIFSVVNGVLLEPLPYPEPDRLVMVWGNHVQIGRETASYPDFLDWRAENQSFEGMAAIRGLSINLTGRDEPERLIGAGVSAEMFELLGVPPQLGRAFRPEEDRPGAGGVVVLSHGLWLRRFGGDPEVVGQVVELNGENHVVVGVMPPGFAFPDWANLWVPLALDVNQTGRRADFLRVVARLKQDVTVEMAQAELKTIMRRLEQQYPATNDGWSALVVPLHEEVVGNIRPALLVLLGAVGLVLLIACANVANLLLARATGREPEMALRTALGARRGRLIRQMMTESLLLASLGGLAGLALGYGGIRLLVAFKPGAIPRVDGIGLDVWVLAFTLAVTLLTGVLFGLAPALQVAGRDLRASLEEGGRSGVPGRRGHRLRSLLVVAEVALSLMLLISAGLLLRSFHQLLQVDPGFNPEHLLTMRLSLSDARYREPQQRAEFFDTLRERVQALPGAQSVSVATALPISGGGGYWAFVIDGRPAPPPGTVVDANIRAVSPDYFQTMGIPLMAGRGLSEHDHERAARVALINEAAAERYWPNGDCLGQRIDFGDGDGQPNWREIVGVVGDVQHEGLDQAEVPAVYLPFRQLPSPMMTLVVRTAGEPLALTGLVRDEVRALDREQPVYSVQTMRMAMSASVAQRRFNMMLLGLFAAVALLLASFGIYGVMSYVTSRRSHEIGLRQALGATPADVLRLVVGQGMLMAAVGVGLGLAGSLAVTRLMTGLLFGISASDPLTFAAIALLLGAVAGLACYLPARRAARVDPVKALRYE